MDVNKVLFQLTKVTEHVKTSTSATLTTVVAPMSASIILEVS